MFEFCSCGQGIISLDWYRFEFDREWNEDACFAPLLLLSLKAKVENHQNLLRASERVILESYSAPAVGIGLTPAKYPS